MRNYRWIYLLAFILIALLTGACSQPSPSSQIIKIENLSDEECELIYHLLYQPERISVPVAGAGRAYAPASKEQGERLKEKISQIDLAAFEKFDGITDFSNMFTGVICEYAGKAYNVNLEQDVALEFAYLTFMSIPEPTVKPDSPEPVQIVLRGPASALPGLTDINDIVISIGLDRDDPENCAKITVLSDLGPSSKAMGDTYSLNKAFTAHIRYSLESEFTEDSRSPAAPLSEEEYDLQIEIGDNVYLLDVDQWIVTIKGGETYQLDDTLANAVSRRLGYKSQG